MPRVLARDYGATCGRTKAASSLLQCWARMVTGAISTHCDRARSVHAFSTVAHTSAAGTREGVQHSQAGQALPTPSRECRSTPSPARGTGSRLRSAGHHDPRRTRNFRDGNQAKTNAVTQHQPTVLATRDTASQATSLTTGSNITSTYALVPSLAPPRDAASMP